jgi:hypothetical protein
VGSGAPQIDGRSKTVLHLTMNVPSLAHLQSDHWSILNICTYPRNGIVKLGRSEQTEQIATMNEDPSRMENC